MKDITEKYIEMRKELYACFIDYSKAFDTINNEQLISSLSGTEVDDNDIAVIAHQYWQQITRICNGSDLTEPVKIKKRSAPRLCSVPTYVQPLHRAHIQKDKSYRRGEDKWANINNL